MSEAHVIPVHSLDLLFTIPRSLFRRPHSQIGESHAGVIGTAIENNQVSLDPDVCRYMDDINKTIRSPYRYKVIN